MIRDQPDVEVALAAAAAGANAVRRRYGADLARLAKSPTDFATEADLAAEEAIHRVISAARPSDIDRPLEPTARSLIVDVNCDGKRDASFVGAQLIADQAFRDRFAPRVLSSTLAVAWVAAGRRATYVTDGYLDGSVHFAAGIALCQAARCVVTDLAGDAVHTGRGFIAAADRSTHRQIVELVRPHLGKLHAQRG